MNFGEQIKNIRNQNCLTQEQFAEKLNVSRQAISNWENDRNLPDLEMLINMAIVFHVSLDELILGEKTMNNITEKLIRDGSETRRARHNLISVCIGGGLLLIGAALIVIKAASKEYVDETGMLQENFFLIPMSFAFSFAGVMTFLITGINNAINMKHDKNCTGKGSAVILVICALVVIAAIMAIVFLIKANS